MARRKKVHATQLGLLGPDFDRDYHLTPKGYLVPIKSAPPSSRRGEKGVRREAPEAFRHRPKGEE